jgi:hypothetical protein
MVHIRGIQLTCNRSLTLPAALASKNLYIANPLPSVSPINERKGQTTGSTPTTSIWQGVKHRLEPKIAPGPLSLRFMGRQADSARGAKLGWVRHAGRFPQRRRSPKGEGYIGSLSW